MKKFSEFKKRDLLTFEQMGSIYGGRVQPKQELLGPKTGTCGWLSTSGTYQCGVSKAEAQFMAEGGGWWCCDSCSQTSYCGA